MLQLFIHSKSIHKNVAKFRKIQADIHYTHPSGFMRTKFYRFNNLALYHAGLYFLKFKYSANSEFFCSALSPTSVILSFEE